MCVSYEELKRAGVSEQEAQALHDNRYGVLMNI